MSGIAKFSATGSLIYFAYFGGTPSPINFEPSGVAADSSGNVYVTGITDSTDFPLKNPIQNLLQGTQDAYILKVDSTGSSLVYSTYFGADTRGLALAVDAAENAYLTGTGGTIPVTNGVFQSSPKSSFVAKIGPAGAQVYGTYLGGSQAADAASAIAVDANGNAYVAGTTQNTDFPVKNAYQATLGSIFGNGFVTKLTPDAAALVYSTYLGGTDPARITAIALDSTGAAYVAGTAGGANFPLVNPIQSEFLDTFSFMSTPLTVFITAFTSGGSTLQYSTFLGGFDPDVPAGLGVDSARNAYVGGGIEGVPVNAPYIHGFPIVGANNGLFQPFFKLCVRDSCEAEGFIAKISPSNGTAFASPLDVDFGTVPNGSSSAVVTILIADVGSTDLQINNTSITGDYSINRNSCSGTLSSSKHCEIDVLFSPIAAGTRTGLLTITSTAPDSPRQIHLTGNAAVPVVSLNPTSLSLTSPSVGTAGPAQSVVLKNIGSDTLNITGLSIIGSNAADFSETHNCGGTLGVGLSCNVDVSYKASTSNTETATLQFTDNAAGSPHTVALTGVISTLGLGVAPGGSATTTVSAGQSASYNLVIGGPGSSGSVILSCTGAPIAASCTVPGSENLSSTVTNFQASVSTTARSGAALQPFPPDKIFASVVLVISLPVLLIWNHRTRKVFALAFAGACVMVMVSCGGGGGTSPNPGPRGTPAGSYTLTVTANNRATSQSINLTLTVN